MSNTATAPAVEAIKAKIRSNRDRLLADRTTMLKLPGWEALYVRYGRLPWEQMRPLAIGFAEASDAQAEVGSAIDVLVAGCETFVWKNDDGTFQDLDVRYEAGLKDLGVIEDGTLAEAGIVMSVFADDETALMSHAGEYLLWANRQEDEADEALGKSSSGTDDSN